MSLRQRNTKAVITPEGTSPAFRRCPEGTSPAFPPDAASWAPDASIPWSTTPGEQQVVLGAIAYLTYVGLWVFGLSSPLLVVAALAFGWYRTAIALLSAIGASYLPRRCIPVLQFYRRFYRFAATRYFRRSTMVLEAEPDVSTPTVYCVHPHGIFCIGWAAATLLPALEDVTWCFSSVLEAAPVFRLFLRLLNRRLAGASKDSILRLMGEKKYVLRCRCRRRRDGEGNQWLPGLAYCSL